MKVQERFLLGNSYRKLDGEYVRFVSIHNHGTDTETMEDEFGINRYTNNSELMGMAASLSPSEDNPLNTPPLYFEDLK